MFMISPSMKIAFIWLPLTVLCTFFVLGTAAQRRQHRSAPHKPNVVLLFMDDLGYGDLGFTGHPTTSTPNLDKLAYNGKILTTWYSGCNVCTGSRAALMTGRQFPRTGLPGVLSSTVAIGLPLNETTIAEHLKEKGGYATAVVGKWHLGQRQIYLPANRGFDYYLGIPYSDDMGNGFQSSCPSDTNEEVKETPGEAIESSRWPSMELYEENGFSEAFTNTATDIAQNDPAGKYLPLVYQDRYKNETKVLEQPLDFTTVAEKYNDFALNFIEKHKEQPFFLYMPFSHVHTTQNTPELQYAGCNYKNATRRGAFGDALAESDWIVGNVMKKLDDLGLEEDTLVLFTSDNGPWMIRSLSGGSEGLFTGSFAGYSDTGKGSTWEGGIRMPAFAYWKGKIPPFSRSAEIVSSLDVFPTISSLAGLPIPPNRTYDGRDMSDVLLNKNGKSKHDFLFFYQTSCTGEPYWSISSVRHGKYKAHWCTRPGFDREGYAVRIYDPPLLFNIEKDPSESKPISFNAMPEDPEDSSAMDRILKAYAMEKATFQFGKVEPYPDQPGEGPGKYGVCCDRSRDCNCRDKSDAENLGIFNLGTIQHHDIYHEILGVGEPSPPATLTQRVLQEGRDKRLK